MSKPEPKRPSGKAVALQYGALNSAPMVIASGMGYLAEKIVEVAAENGVPIYEDNSLATMLSQMQLGQEIPPSLYQAVVELYVYFLEFDVNDPEKHRRQRQEAAQAAAEEAARIAAAEAAEAMVEAQELQAQREAARAPAAAQDIEEDDSFEFATFEEIERS